MEWIISTNYLSSDNLLLISLLSYFEQRLCGACVALFISSTTDQIRAFFLSDLANGWLSAKDMVVEQRVKPMDIRDGAHLLKC